LFKLSSQETCRERMKDFVYFCTDSFWNLSNFFLMFLFAGITFLLSRKIKFILFLSITSSLLAIAAGVLLLVPTFEDDNIVFYFIMGILAFVYASLAGNKLVYVKNQTRPILKFSSQMRLSTTNSNQDLLKAISLPGSLQILILSL